MRRHTRGQFACGFDVELQAILGPQPEGLMLIGGGGPVAPAGTPQATAKRAANRSANEFAAGTGPQACSPVSRPAEDLAGCRRDLVCQPRRNLNWPARDPRSMRRSRACRAGHCQPWEQACGSRWRGWARRCRARRRDGGWPPRRRQAERFPRPETLTGRPSCPFFPATTAVGGVAGGCCRWAKLSPNCPPQQRGLPFRIRNRPLTWSPLTESTRRPSPYH